MGDAMNGTLKPPSGIVKFLHNIPHYDFEFGNVSSDFNPKSSEYQQAIGIFVCAPIAWMGLWLIIYSIYFSYFYCICLFMNEFLHSHIVSSEESWSGIRNTFYNMEKQTLTTQWRLDSVIYSTGRMNEEFDKAATLDENLRPLLKSYASEISANMTNSERRIRLEVWSPFTQIDTHISPRLSQYSHLEMYRRYGSHIVIGSTIVILALTMCSIGTKQKVFILICLAFVIIIVIALWLAAGFYSGLSIAAADFCADTHTNSPMLELIADIRTMQGSREVLDYYTYCGDTPSPFNEVVEECSAALTAAQATIDNVTAISVSLSDDLKHAIAETQFNITNSGSHMSSLSSVLHCTTVNDMYTESLEHICDSAISSVAVMAGGFIIAGFLIIFLVFTLHSASRFVGNRRSYLEGESVELSEKKRMRGRTSNAINYRFSQYDSSDHDEIDSRSRDPSSAGRQMGRQASRQSYPERRPRNGPPAGRRPKTSIPVEPNWNPNIR